MKTFILNFLFFLSGFSYRFKNRYLFGAWFGQRFSDNPKFLLLQMLEDKRYKDARFIWICNKNIESEIGIDDFRLTIVERNSFKSIIAQLSSKYIFMSHGYQDFGSLNLTRNSDSYQLWHGFPIKKIAKDNSQTSTEGDHYYQRYRFFLADSVIMKKRLITAFSGYGANEKSIIIANSPKSDYLLKNKNNEQLKSEIRKKIGILDSAQVVSYFPTFRDNSKKMFSFTEYDSTLKDELLSNNMVILERQHLAAKHQTDISENNRIIELSDNIDVQDVLLISDYLITDFSSVYVDFLVMNKPIIHFLFDGLEYIKEDRQTYAADPISEFAGPIAYSLEELMNILIFEKLDFHQLLVCAKRKLMINHNDSLLEKMNINND